MKIRIKNFQSLEDISFEVEGVTVITGDSDVGKSSVIRAVEGCLFNKSGNYFIKDGKEGTGVRITDGDSSIVWMKGKAGGTYDINDQKFTAIGRSQLSEISDLGYRELDVDTLKIRPQISKQFSPQFLISDEYSPSVVSKLLGDLSGVKKIVTAKKICNKDFTTQKTLEKVLISELDTESKILKKLQPFDSFPEELALLKKQREDILYRQSLIEEARELIKRKKSLQNVVFHLSNLKGCQDKGNNLKASIVLISPLLELIRCEKVVKNLSSFDNSYPTPRIEEKLEVVKLLSLLSISIKKLKAIRRWRKSPYFTKMKDKIELISDVQRYQEEERKRLVKMERLDNLEDQILDNIENLNKFDFCPLCENKLCKV